MIRSGTVALPAPPTGEPFIDAEEVADVVVAALTEDGHTGEIYEVTGPRLLRFDEAVAEIGAEISGAGRRRVTFTQITSDEFVAGLVGQGFPAGDAEAFAAIFDTVLDGRNAHPGDGVQRALGRAPRDFSSYVATTAATGVWAA